MATEKTLILIKPDGIAKRLTGLVIDRIESAGLEMVAAKVLNVSESLARDHYKAHKDQPFFPGLIKFIRGEYNGTNGKIYAFVYKGENAISAVRKVVGATNPEKALPGTVRCAFGRIVEGRMENVVHASSDAADAEREIALWFRSEELVG